MQNRLKELRKGKKLTQAKFTKFFNDFLETNPKLAVVDYKGRIKQVSQATVSRWEVGTTPIPTKYSKALAKYFRVSLAYFLGEHFNEFVDPLSQSLADTLTNLPPQIAELARSAAYSVIDAYEASKNEN